MAEAFDDDPFLILRWRGRDREELLSRLRELRADGGPVDRAEGTPSSAGTALALSDLPEPADPMDRFWQPGLPLPARPAVMEADPDLLLRQLPPPDATLGGDALTDRLRSAYQRMSRTGPSSP